MNITRFTVSKFTNVRLISSKELITVRYEQLKKEPGLFMSYIRLAQSLTKTNPHVKIEDKICTKVDILLEAIRKFPLASKAYFLLGTTLNDLNETITLPVGTKMNKRQLFFAAIYRDSKFSPAFYELAKTMTRDESVMLPFGEEATKIDILLYLIHVRPGCYKSYRALVVELKMGERIKLLDGRELSRSELLLISVKKMHLFKGRAQGYKFYYYLSIQLHPDETIVLYRKTYNRKDLLLKAITDNPNHAQSYAHLALLITEDDDHEKIRLPNNEELTRKQLALKSVIASPGCTLPFVLLSKWMDVKETVQLPDGPSYTKKEILDKYDKDYRPEKSHLRRNRPYYPTKFFAKFDEMTKEEKEILMKNTLEEELNKLLGEGNTDDFYEE